MTGSNKRQGLLLTCLAMLDDTVHFLANQLEAPDWRRLGEHLLVEWIEEAVQRTDATSIRHRRLPAEQVVWLMVALALYRHKSISEVLDDLGLALPDAQAPFVSKSAAAQARQRVGSDPLKWLFDHSAQHWCSQDRRAYVFKGLMLFAMDGTTLRTHDNAETREHFGAQNYSSGAVASYPQVRGVTVTALSTHLVHSAAFGQYGTNEMLYAKQLIEGIPNDSLTVFDRGFLSAEILCALIRGGSERYFMIPTKSNTRWEVIEGDENDDDFTVRMRVPSVQSCQNSGKRVLLPSRSPTTTYRHHSPKKGKAHTVLFLSKNFTFQGAFLSPSL